MDAKENHAPGVMVRHEPEAKAKAGSMRCLEAEEAKERADAEEKARKVQEEAARAKAKAYAEAKKAAMAARKAEARVRVEAAAKAKAEVDAKTAEEAEVKAAEAKAAAARAELETRQKAEQERLKVEAKSKSEAAKDKAEEERKRFYSPGLAVDGAPRAAAAGNASASSPMSPARGSGGSSWFSLSTIALAGPLVASPPKPGNSDPWSKRHVKNASSPSTELSPLRAPLSEGPHRHTPRRLLQQHYHRMTKLTMEKEIRPQRLSPLGLHPMCPTERRTRQQWRQPRNP
ncbi:hypothetical protein EDB87DRAFT_19098 [Lactarius vividus]|nr:hypothetical protein EDB87DRAFT_19098 [Lactarius vividus]